MASEPRSLTVRYSNLTHDRDTSLNSNEYRWVAKHDFSSNSGEAWGLGRGDTEVPDEATGFVYHEIYNCAGNQITDGDMRAAVYTQGGRLVGTFYDIYLGEMDAGENTRTDRRPLEARTYTGEDGSEYRYSADPRELRWEVKLNSGTATFDESNSNNKFIVEGEKVVA